MLPSDVVLWRGRALQPSNLPAVLVDRLKGEAATRQLHESHGTGGTRGMALEPLVNGLIGDAQIWFVGERGHDALHAEVANPSAELGLLARWISLVGSHRQSLLPEHPSAPEAPSGNALRPVWGEDTRPPKEKGGSRASDGDMCRRRAAYSGAGAQKGGRCARDAAFHAPLAGQSMASVLTNVLASQYSYILAVDITGPRRGRHGAATRPAPDSRG